MDDIEKCDLQTGPRPSISRVAFATKNNEFLTVPFRHQSYPRVSQLESLAQCEDAEWMKRKGVRTYYPPGTVCYRDPSRGKSCGMIITRFTYFNPPSLLC